MQVRVLSQSYKEKQMIRQMNADIAQELRKASQAIRKANDQKNVAKSIVKENGRRYKEARSMPQEKPYALDIIGGPGLNFAELMSHTEELVFREDKEKEHLYWETARQIALNQNLQQYQSICQALAKLLLQHLELCYQHGENFNVYLPPILESIIEGREITNINRLTGY